MSKPPVLHVKEWCPGADGVFSELLVYPWKQEHITMFGKVIPEPRKVLWFAPSNHSYTYSGKQNDPLPLPQLLQDLAEYAEQTIEEELQKTVVFNSCFCNLYEDGTRYLGWHADNEKGLASNIIASISFGSTRDFKLRRNSDKDITTFPLAHGDLLVMYDTCQDDYKHSVPKRIKVTEPRINLTFRCYESK